MAIRKDRDAKAELNRRSQVCEILAGTGISRRESIPKRTEPAVSHYFGRARPLPTCRVHLGNWFTGPEPRPTGRKSDERVEISTPTHLNILFPPLSSGN